MLPAFSRPFRHAAIAVLCCASIPSVAREPLAERVTLIHAGTLIALPGREEVREATIVVRGERIAEIRPGFAAASEISDAKEAAVVDLRDLTVLPGLIDTHVHLMLDPDFPAHGYAQASAAQLAITAAANARTTLRAGFTTVRDVGSLYGVVNALRDAVASGLVEGPRIQSSDATISIIGGHGDIGGFRTDVAKVFEAALALCTGAVECADKVRSLSKNGADVIKLNATGGVLSEQDRGLDQQMTDAELGAVVATAHSLGLKVAAHAHGDGGIAAAVKAGVDSIEHGTFLSPSSAKLMQQRGTVLVPTLMAWQGLREGLAKGSFTPPAASKARLVLATAFGKALEQARRMRVRIAFGTDAGVYPHGRNAGEFRLMVEHGLTAREALVAATTSAAELMGLGREIGSIEPGKRADIIAVAGNPYADPSSYERVRFVMANGRIAVADPSPPCTSGCPAAAEGVKP